MLRRGLLRRCPVCGRRGLFRHLRMVERCPRCGLRFERADGTWSGALGLNTMVVFSLLFVVLLGGTLATWPDVAVVPIATAAAAVALLGPLLFFPTSKTLWLAIELCMHPLQPDEVDPTWLRGEQGRAA